jgi:DNA modification methylase
MRTVNLPEIDRLLNRIDWNFEDYVSSSYPEDINSLHWYPAAFVPHIPAILVQVFSTPETTVLDPFVGSGVTLVEAAKQGRAFIGVDSNPFAVEISKAKFQAIDCKDWSWLSPLAKSIHSRDLTEQVESYCAKVGIKDEILKWFHPATVKDLLVIHSCITGDPENFLLKKVVFSSILKSCCSQRKHYTYITDRCFPKQFVQVDAKAKYIQQINLARTASEKFKQYYEKINSRKWEGSNGEVTVGDARDLSWIGSEQVNLILTSPPYLGCNDYAKSMRLTHLFFPSHDMKELIKSEIGARCKRHSKSLQEEYLQDIMVSLRECERVLNRFGYLALVFGQGKGHARSTDVIQFITEFLTNQLHFEGVFDTERSIMFHRVRFPGVTKEHIMVFRKPSMD